ncbi:tetratricopeptide repeat protein [Adhaeribacter terreus]|uniref:Tetratricopeptide repeat protein n=2 Tax=Adhaeribacter terreus TaxID=529703 RepID=A0ABW0E764_9BACT
MECINSTVICLLVFFIMACTTTAEDYEKRAKVRMGRGDIEGALEDFDKAIELNPDFHLAYANRGNAKRKIGDYEGSIRDFDKIIADTKDKSGIGAIFLDRGETKAASKDFIGALNDYDKAISLKPEGNAPNHYYYYRALTKYELNDKIGACADMLKAREKGNKEAAEWIKKICD